MIQQTNDLINREALILEFMGYEYYNDSPIEYPQGYYFRRDPENHTSMKYPDCTDYHFNWNSIMEVVDKIESITNITGTNAYRQDITIRTRISSISTKIILYDKRGSCFKMISSSNFEEHKSKLQNTWNTCVTFIQWYNQLTKNE